ncbi:MAG: TonB-dependent receptor [Deltaproteobacteria bacterium]|nr:TonB-dependent receptor [Deltaproteobacteria bacterium]
MPIKKRTTSSQLLVLGTALSCLVSNGRATAQPAASAPAAEVAADSAKETENADDDAAADGSPDPSASDEPKNAEPNPIDDQDAVESESSDTADSDAEDSDAEDNDAEDNDAEESAEEEPLPGVLPPDAPPPPSPVTDVDASSQAQEKKPKKVEELYVTGSRIRRLDLATSAPVTVVDREELDASGLVSIGDILQNLPVQSNAINVQFNNGGDGSTRVSLRGLGAQRTLVLLNGRRFVPGGVGADSSVDLNTIPIEVIDRVEVFKDGASATYGSDAIAGVVNIITKRDFSGVEASSYIGGTKAGGLIYNLGVTGGETSEKGNFFLSFQYYKQQEILSGQRKYSQTEYYYDFDDQQAYRSGSTRVPEGYIADGDLDSGNAAWRAVQGAAGEGSALFNDPVTGWRAFNFDGNSDAGDGDLYNYAPENYLMTPSQRMSFFGAGQYDLSDRVTGYVEATFTNRTSTQLLAPEPLATSGEQLVLTADNVYNPFGRDLYAVNRRLVEFGNRTYGQDLDTYRAVIGLRGNYPEDLGMFSDWRWDASFVFGRTSGLETKSGLLIRSRLQNAVGPSYFDRNGMAVCGTRGSPISGCVPINLLGGAGSITKEMRDYLTYVGVARGYTDQMIFSFDTNGELFELFGQPVSLAAGYQFRDESGQFTPDPLTAKGDTTGNKSEATGGEFKEHAAYVELNIPLLSGMPGVELLELDGQLRVFNFDTFGTDQMWKTGLKWQIVKDLMLRGTVSRAFRTPSIIELYRGVSDSFENASDPCSTLNGPRTPAQQAQCSAQGVPDTFLDAENQIRTLVGGNTKLGPETASIKTVGLAFTPQFAPWAKNLSLTLDYFHIKITDTIQARGTSVILNNCYSAEGGQSADCDLIVRDADTHKIVYVNDVSDNIGGTKTSGLDVELAYTYPTDLGRFRFNLEGTWLQQYREYQPARKVSGKGVYDLEAVYPAIRFNTGVAWSLSGFGLGTNMRYIGPIKECADNNCEGDAPYRDVDSNVTVDVFGSYGLASDYGFTSVTAGINNVFDQDPPRIYQGFLANSDAGTYDYIGRYFYMGLRHQL